MYAPSALLNETGFPSPSYLIAPTNHARGTALAAQNGKERMKLLSSVKCVV
jgi:hypothetical protein